MTTGADQLVLTLPAAFFLLLVFWSAVGLSPTAASLLAAVSLPPLVLIAVIGAKNRRSESRPKE